jgi:hypothetical protein
VNCPYADCGAVVPEGAQFCPRCGRAVQLPEVPRPTPEAGGAAPSPYEARVTASFPVETPHPSNPPK